MSRRNEFKLAEDFAELAGRLQAEKSERPTLDRVVRSAVESIDPCDYCGITLREPDGHLTTAAASDSIAERAAELEVQWGEGPCLDAIWESDTMVVNDLHSDGRWPQWAPAAVDLGIRSMAGLLLDVTGTPLVASLNLFSSRLSSFDAIDVDIAGIFASHAAQALATAHAEDGLRAATQSRQMIGAAQGILMQEFNLTLDQAFELLRRYSEGNNIKVRVLAERLVNAGGIRAAPSEGFAVRLERAFQLNGES